MVRSTNLDFAMGVLGRIRAVVGVDLNEEIESEDREPAHLVECRECETVLITDSMDSCPTCGERVQHVPNERDLAMERGS